MKFPLLPPGEHRPPCGSCWEGGREGEGEGEEGEEGIEKDLKKSVIEEKRKGSQVQRQMGKKGERKIEAESKI